MATRLRIVSDVPPRYLELIGAVTVNFSSLEYSLSMSIWWLLGDTTPEEFERARVVTAQLTFKQLVWTFANLYRSRFGDRSAKRLEGIIKRCFQLESERNTVIHSSWIRGSERSTAVRLKMSARSAGFRADLKEHSEEKLIGLTNAMGDVCRELQEWVFREMQDLLDGKIAPQPGAGGAA